MLAQNPKLVSMIQNKLGTLVGQSSGYIESLPPNVRRRIVGLQGVQKEHSKLDAEMQKEILELEKKYFAKFTPLYEKRAAIVNGKSEPSNEEVTAGEEASTDEEGKPSIKTEPTEDEDNTPMTGIPEFWLTAMKNEPSLMSMIEERDEDALKFLSDIRMEYLDKPGFRLVFEFAENEFFENRTISKTYVYQDETSYTGDFVYDHAEGDKIQWKAEKDLTTKVETKKQRNKSKSSTHRLLQLYSRKSDTKQTRVIKKTVPTDSFFNFFSPPKPPSDDDEEEAASDIEERLELDYTLGEDIKEKLIPHAIDWFTGEALRFEEAIDDVDDAQFEDEDDEDHDSLSEEPESEEEDVRKPRI